MSLWQSSPLVGPVGTAHAWIVLRGDTCRIAGRPAVEVSLLGQWEDREATRLAHPSTA